MINEAKIAADVVTASARCGGNPRRITIVDGVLRDAIRDVASETMTAVYDRLSSLPEIDAETRAAIKRALIDMGAPLDGPETDPETVAAK